MAKELQAKDFTWNDEKKFLIRDIAGRSGEHMSKQAIDIVIAQTLLYKGKPVSANMVRFLPAETQQMVQEQIDLDKLQILTNLENNVIAQNEKIKKDKEDKEKARQDKLDKEKEDSQPSQFPPLDAPEGYIISREADLEPGYMDYLEGQIMYLRLWSNRFPYDEVVEATYEIKTKNRTYSGLLKQCLDNLSYKDSLVLSNTQKGDGTVKMELVNQEGKKYKVVIQIRII